MIGDRICAMVQRGKIGAVGGFMRRRSTFKKADLTRATKAVQAAGLEVVRIEVSRDGLIVIVPGQPEGAVRSDGAPRNGNAALTNDLDRELAEFRVQHDED
jgi:hypothetical protein